VGADHGGADIRMTEQLLHRADIPLTYIYRSILKAIKQLGYHSDDFKKSNEVIRNEANVDPKKKYGFIPKGV